MYIYIYIYIYILYYTLYVYIYIYPEEERESLLAMGALPGSSAAADTERAINAFLGDFPEFLEAA